MKVYDCFTFFNELELLELRLKLLNDVVDYFVLVESDKTHRYKDKDYVFEANKDMFREYLGKIIHIKAEMPSYDPATESWWKLENYQRNSIAQGLKDCSPEDLVMISDMDEIPNPEVIKQLRENRCEIVFFPYDKLLKNIGQLFVRFPSFLFKHHGTALLDKVVPLALEQTFLCYFINCRSKTKWHGTVVTKFKYVKTPQTLSKHVRTPQLLRDRRDKNPRIKNGGWHFSYLGGIERVLEKATSIVGEGPMLADSKDRLEEYIKKGLDIYGRNEWTYEFIALADADLPKEVHALIEKYPYFYFDKNTSNLELSEDVL